MIKSIFDKLSIGIAVVDDSYHIHKYNKLFGKYFNFQIIKTTKNHFLICFFNWNATIIPNIRKKNPNIRTIFKENSSSLFYF